MYWRRSALSFAIAASCLWCVRAVQSVHQVEQAPTPPAVETIESGLEALAEPEGSRLPEPSRQAAGASNVRT